MSKRIETCGKHDDCIEAPALGKTCHERAIEEAKPASDARLGAVRTVRRQDYASLGEYAHAVVCGPSEWFDLKYGLTGKKFYRMRRGKLVEIPAKWVGNVTSPNKIRQRRSKMIHKLRKDDKHGGYGGNRRTRRDQECFSEHVEDA